MVIKRDFTGSLNITDAAFLLGVTDKTLRNWRDKESCQAISSGGAVDMPRLVLWLQDRAREPIQIELPEIELPEIDRGEVGISPEGLAALLSVDVSVVENLNLIAPEAFFGMDLQAIPEGKRSVSIRRLINGLVGELERAERRISLWKEMPAVRGA